MGEFAIIDNLGVKLHGHETYDIMAGFLFHYISPHLGGFNPLQTVFRVLRVFFKYQCQPVHHKTASHFCCIDEVRIAQPGRILQSPINSPKKVIANPNPTLFSHILSLLVRFITSTGLQIWQAIHVSNAEEGEAGGHAPNYPWPRDIYTWLRP